MIQCQKTDFEGVAMGVKIFVLCGKCGLEYDFIINQGATTDLDTKSMKKIGLGASVVLDLTKRITDEGHKFYYGNYFSSLQLCEILKQRIIRLNRFGSNPPRA